MASKKVTKRPRKPYKTQDPMLIKVKETLAKQISTAMNDAGLTQADAANLTREAQSQLSLIQNMNLRGFSTDRLQLILVRLGHNVSITVSKSQSKSGRITINT